MKSLKRYIPSWKTVKLVSFIVVVYMFVYGVFIYMKELAAAVVTFMVLRYLASTQPDDKPVAKQ